MLAIVLEQFHMQHTGNQEQDEEDRSNGCIRYWRRWRSQTLGLGWVRRTHFRESRLLSLFTVNDSGHIAIGETDSWTRRSGSPSSTTLTRRHRDNS